MSNFNMIISITLIIVLVSGCFRREIEYFSNPYVFTVQEINDIDQISDIKLTIVDDKLIINTKNDEIDVTLPDHYVDIQSFQFSYDKRFLAYDVLFDGGVKIFVIDLESGDKTNMSEFSGYEFTYDGYQAPYGMAWAPNKNLIAIIGGYNNVVKIDLHHFEMDERKQAPLGSFAFEDIYGVKWDHKGDSIYYVVDSTENEKMYELYQTEIESDSYLLASTVNVITELSEEDLIHWLNIEE